MPICFTPDSTHSLCLLKLPANHYRVYDSDFGSKPEVVELVWTPLALPFSSVSSAPPRFKGFGPCPPKVFPLQFIPVANKLRLRGEILGSRLKISTRVCIVD